MFYYTPIMLAKRPQGRMICGLGWSKDEYQASNIPFMNSGERANEFIQVLNKIWTDDIVEFKV
jgi:alkanesulfonate monooxygenase SsuD/methylene tetrahydromethanopterin reductase-like flavin-dependent oxidoreductase (luciferase family)